MEGLVFTTLVVDDEANIRLGAERILRGSGFDVLTAESGEEGIELLAEHECHILLLDLMMPGMPGMEVLKHVSVAYPELIVIIITGYATLETAVEAMKRGAYDFIAKPFQPDQLRIVVSRASEKLRFKAEHKRFADERRRNLRHIELEKTRTQAIVQSMSEGVLLTDATGAVVLCNPAAKHLLDLDGTPLPSTHLSTFIPNQTLRELVVTVCQRQEAPTQSSLCTRELQLDDGRWLLAKISPVVTGEGEETGALTVLSDITNHKDLAAMKNEFVAKVSHELRSPLAAINQQLNLIIGSLDESHVDELRRLGRVRERTKGLIDMIADLLDLSRLELGITEQTCEEVEPVHLLEHVMELLTPKATKKHLDLRLTCRDLDAPLCLHMDPRELESVYVNLISNAIKYTPRGGQVEVVAGKMTDGMFCLDVTDTGIGIQQEELDRIFEKFYRVRGDETRMIVGTGLGLPIVRSVVEAYGGAIDVKSSPGRGSTFTVTLPLGAPNEDEAS